jgi:hypothetical protein
MIIPTEIRDKILLLLPRSELIRIKKEDGRLKLNPRTISPWVIDNTKYHKLLNAFRYGTIENIKWLGNETIYRKYITEVIQRGDLNIIKYIDSRVQWPDDICTTAIRSMHIHVVEWFMNKGFKLQYNALFIATDEKNLNMIKFVVENGCFWLENIFIIAICTKDFDIIQYIHKLYYEKYGTYILGPYMKDLGGGDWNLMTTDMLYGFANASIMDWYNEYMYTFTQKGFWGAFVKLCYNKECDRNYDTVNWFITNGFTPDDSFADFIFNNQRTDLSMIDPLIWLKMNKCPWNDKRVELHITVNNMPYNEYIIDKYKNHKGRNIMNMAAFMGDINDMKYMYLMGEKFDDQTIYPLIDLNEIEIIKWLCSMKYHVNKRMFDYAKNNDKPHIANYLYEYKWKRPPPI